MHFQSETIGDLAKALAAAQGEMSAAAKDATNPHFKTRYADLASIMDACRGPLAKHGLAVTQLPGRGDDGAVTLTTVLMHASGQHIGSTVGARPAQENPQVVGSILTYLRRYALASVVGVVSDDDDGEAASHHARSAPARPVEPPRQAHPTATPAAPQNAPQRPAQRDDGPTMSTDCPVCGGAMWDNREKKTNPKAPDFKCKDKTCTGVIWRYKAPAAQPIPGGYLEADMRGAPPPFDDDIPF